LTDEGRRKARAKPTSTSEDLVGARAREWLLRNEQVKEVLIALRTVLIALDRKWVRKMSLVSVACPDAASRAQVTR
jgi:hypothetical protein